MRGAQSIVVALPYVERLLGEQLQLEARILESKPERLLRVVVVAARLEAALTRTAGVISLRKMHTALAMIEDAIQKPLDDEFSIPDNLALRRITQREDR